MVGAGLVTPVFHETAAIEGQLPAVKLILRMGEVARARCVIVCKHVRDVRWSLSR